MSCCPRPRAVAAVAAIALSITTQTLAANWEPLPSMPVAKGDGFGVLWNGADYVVGGPPWMNGTDQDGSVYRLSGAVWSGQAPMNGVGPFVSQGGGIDGLNRLVFFGGVDPSSGDGGPTMLYDPVNGATTVLASRPASAPKQGFGFCTDNLGRIYSLGGGNGAGATSSAFCTRYVASTNAWTTLASLPVAVSQAAAAFDGDGHILVFGGFNANGSARTADVQRFDIASGTWSNVVVPDMPVALSNAMAIRGDDHRIYVMGGIDASGTVRQSTYVLDLWANAWSVGPSMAVAREHAAVVRDAESHIQVIGGRGTGGVALASAEQLYTAPCPTIVSEPTDVNGWAGLPVGFSVAAVGGTPLTYQWRRDGVPLGDGPLASGGVVTGATTNTLSIASATDADIGAYDVVVTTPCGSDVSQTVTFSLRPAPTMPPRWSVTLMHPAWANWSRLRSAADGVQVGSAWMPFASWSMIEQPTVWHGTADSATNIAPAGSAGGGVAAIELAGGNTTMAGWWWWPYDCSSGGQWYTCYSMESASWTGSGSQHHNLQVSGWEFSEATGVGNGIKGGYVWTDDSGPDTYTFNAGVWLPPNDTFVNVQPANVWRSIIQAAEGPRQFGWIFTNDSFTAHAAGWSGSAATCVDMNPPGYARSLLYGAGSDQQVGITGSATTYQAGLWGGSAGSFRSLHPSDATLSAAWACNGGYQVGELSTQTTKRAVIWAGSPESMVDLNALLPSGYASSAAYGVYVAKDGTVTVVGSAWSSATLREEAVMWVSAAAVVGDLDGDGSVGGADLAILLGAWGSAGGPADLNGDGTVDGADLAVLLGAWG